jgi:hypothetical protein
MPGVCLDYISNPIEPKCRRPVLYSEISNYFLGINQFRDWLAVIIAIAVVASIFLCFVLCGLP